MVNRRAVKSRHEVLRKARLEANVEQYELAAILGVDPSGISKYEHGHHEYLPRGLTTEDYLDALARLAAVDFAELATELGVSLRELDRVRARQHPQYIDTLRRLAGVPDVGSRPRRRRKDAVALRRLAGAAAEQVA